VGADQLVIIAVVLAFVAGGSALMILWGMEESERARRPPLYERARPGPFGVELVATGRRQMAVLRLVRQARRGSLGEAFHLVRHPPALIVEGIAREDAEWLVRALEAKGARARVVRGPQGDRAIPPDGEG